jgi:hypothetical protein
VERKKKKERKEREKKEKFEIQVSLNYKNSSY